MSDPHEAYTEHSTPQHAFTGTAHGGHAAAINPFSEQEWDFFHKEDIIAGRMIVGLMTAIFLIGLFLYTAIAIIVMP